MQKMYAARVALCLYMRDRCESRIVMTGFLRQPLLTMQKYRAADS